MFEWPTICIITISLQIYVSKNELELSHLPNVISKARRGGQVVNNNIVSSASESSLIEMGYIVYIRCQPFLCECKAHASLIITYKVTKFSASITNWVIFHTEMYFFFSACVPVLESWLLFVFLFFIYLFVCFCFFLREREKGKPKYKLFLIMYVLKKSNLKFNNKYLLKFN